MSSQCLCVPGSWGPSICEAEIARALQIDLAVFPRSAEALLWQAHAGPGCFGGCALPLRTGRMLVETKVGSRLRDLLRATRPAGLGQPAEGVREDLPALLPWVLEGEARKDLPYHFALPHRNFHRRCGQFPRGAGPRVADRRAGPVPVGVDSPRLPRLLRRRAVRASGGPR